MEFNKETFEKALKANKIIRYQQHFEYVVKSYLEIEKQALHLQQTELCDNLDENYKCKNMCLTRCVEDHKFYK